MSAAVAAVAVGAALFAGWCLAARRTGPRNPGVPATVAGMRGDGARQLGTPRRRRKHQPVEPAEQMQQVAILVAQLASLLRAGRTPEQMWRQASRTWQGDAAGGDGSDLSSRVMASAAHASALGRPAAAAIRDACERAGERGARGGRAASSEAGVWLSVAACIETAEASGSPLAGVLDRLSDQLEADADAAAARAVALAGPKATARVLGVLPLAGLGLGLLMGADPVTMLVSSPWGPLCLGAGCALTVVGRWWSAQLVRAASEAR